MSVKLLLGDEAFAQGALDAGVSGCYAYPGTPSTEIMEYFQASPEAAERNVHRNWSANEKVAMEEGLGMSYAGKRAIVCMKHVGLNVAADGFINAAITGSNGGLLVAAADDPSMHSSQNEQDSRFYAQFAMIPCLEPSSQQEAYDMVNYAFELSEKQEIPVLLRFTTRLSHSRANVQLRGKIAENSLRIPKNPRRFVLLPAIAQQNYRKLCDKQVEFTKASENSLFNLYFEGTDKSFGILCTGLAFNYVQEAFAGKCPYPILKISQYPLPQEKLAKLLQDCQQIMVVEEGMPFVEQQLRGPLGNPRILGRLSAALPRVGELNPRLIQAAFNLPLPNLLPASSLLKIRPPRLCDGCPHANTYDALNEACKDFPDAKVFGDIGCYTLGALPPYNAISTCVDMGASISMAKGAADAGLKTAIAVIGDSTFTHSGMTGLLDAVWENSPITILIVDNYTTGMTGGQDSLGTGRLDAICKGMGVAPEHLRVITPLPKNLAENVVVLKEELTYSGLSVIISRRECIQTLRKKK
ncbi:MAG: thiamine pyrophosphate-dependent enzyme [Lentisphaeria bacterium]